MWRLLCMRLWLTCLSSSVIQLHRIWGALSHLHTHRLPFQSVTFKNYWCVHLVWLELSRTTATKKQQARQEKTHRIISVKSTRAFRMNIFIFVCGVWIEISIDFVCLLLFLQPTKKLTEFLRKPEVQRISDSELNFIIVRSKNQNERKI